MKFRAIVALVGVLMAGSVFAENQVERELLKKQQQAELDKLPKTFSHIEKDMEYVYNLDEATAKKLPKGDNDKLSAAEKNVLEDTIKAIREQKPVRVVAVNKTREAATTACPDYYGNYCGGGYYRGGYYGGYNNCGYSYCNTTYYYPVYSYSYCQPTCYQQPCYQQYYYGGGGFYGGYNNGGYAYANVYPSYGSYRCGGYGYRNAYWYR